MLFYGKSDSKTHKHTHITKQKKLKSNTWNKKADYERKTELRWIMNENRNTFLGCFHDHLRNGNGLCMDLCGKAAKKWLNSNDEC